MLPIMQERSSGEGWYESNSKEQIVNQGSMREYPDIIGESPKIKELKKLIERSARTDLNVLITGETGTGKEIMAKRIWKESNRNNKRYRPINISAIPQFGNLLESTLFGNIRDFPNKNDPERKGIFEEAEGGTLFLDEIGYASHYLQVALLRVIQEKKVLKMGAPHEIDVDFRVICATNKDLNAEIESNNFNSDLYFRINVIHIEVPPLRERTEDIPLLASCFLNKSNKEMNRNLRLSDETAQRLKEYRWPGNVRELENTISRSMFLTPENSPFLEIIGWE
ncbi:MAG: sigma 54-interacting transcriptional regulator [bacterium]